MFRFTIRDLLWLTVVVAVTVCFLLERFGRIDMAARRAAIQSRAVELKAALTAARHNETMRRHTESYSSSSSNASVPASRRYVRATAAQKRVDWTLADKALPE